ncbi:2-phospho-L-lactate transferase [Leucobacter luti]|uniref:LPPG:FO 2-phospho-L-lactate transferase n=1 Tax=Leucobacter luti TaxID=340320 RepID=A0A4Q7U4B1_9MICO|nr:2-phospho-L-lactate transferase [Leucobacter luti]MBL3699482.1 2-phospho-L-lactate transferase [Leucobacter luti]RZT66992.1 LPPG:FO 2-phospho-L-lactate transferase [Leucobacter luti]
MRIVLLSGGVGGARCARALDAWRRTADPSLRLTAIVNVGDDFTHLGVRISPDIDSVTYHLGDLGDTERGWGRAGDSARIAKQIEHHLPDTAWFHLGDLDLGHSLIRTELLASGMPLSRVTQRFLDDFGISARVLPVTDDDSPTIVRVPNGPLSFQEWWVRLRAEPVPERFEYPRAAAAQPAPGVIAAIEEADLVVVAPSNPIVSITPIFEVPGVREAVAGARAPVVGVSPIIGGRPVRGWADRCLAAAGVECSALGVRDFYGSRGAGGLLDGWLVDPVDDLGREADGRGGRGGSGEHSEPGGSGEPGSERTIVTRSVPLRFTGGREDARIVEALLALASSSVRNTEPHDDAKVNRRLDLPHFGI